MAQSPSADMAWNAKAPGSEYASASRLPTVATIFSLGSARQRNVPPSNIGRSINQPLSCSCGDAERIGSSPLLRDLLRALVPLRTDSLTVFPKRPCPGSRVPSHTREPRMDRSGGYVD